MGCSKGLLVTVHEASCGEACMKPRCERTLGAKMHRAGRNNRHRGRWLLWCQRWRQGRWHVNWTQLLGCGLRWRGIHGGLARAGIHHGDSRCQTALGSVLATGLRRRAQSWPERCRAVHCRRGQAVKDTTYNCLCGCGGVPQLGQSHWPARRNWDNGVGLGWRVRRARLVGDLNDRGAEECTEL